MRLTDIPLPATPATESALTVAGRFSSPALVNHGVRSYLFAAALAAVEGLTIDHELLYVSSVLHDIGLEPAFDNHALPFETAGGHVAWAFAAGAGWKEDRCTRASEIIVAHMRDTRPEDDVEGYLLCEATGLDISGRGLARWPEGLPAEVVAAHPRLDLAARFTAYFTDQAERKPSCAAAVAVQSGLAGRMAAHPLEP